MLPSHGSSPRVRGTLGRLHDTSWVCRFIPACAGNALTNHVTDRSISVHPRVCGERSEDECKAFDALGSSPRVRGTLTLLPLGIGGKRFIPACAGNAFQAQSPAYLTAVHPRVCGERVVLPL